MKISAVVPVRDNDPTIAELYRRLSVVLATAAPDAYEIIFVNDGSRDHSWAALEALAWTDRRVVAVDLVRGFGAHNALLCGLAHARGDRVVTLDGGLRDAPEEIPALLHAAESRGLDVVYGVAGPGGALRGVGEALVRLAFRRTFGAGPRLSSFRAVRGAIAAHVAASERIFPSIDGELACFTSRVGDVVVAPGQGDRRSGGSFARDVSLAASTVATYSTAPLRIASLLGALFAIFGFLAGAFVALEKLIFDIPISGYASLIVAITVLGGAQLATLGVLGGYLGRVHANVSGAPRYAIRAVARADDQPTASDAARPAGAAAPQAAASEAQK
jgi:polyisoprenyl-phosphate glycosyltransferase